MMRILYIHPFKSYGGATKSLIEMLKKFPAYKIQPVVIAPQGEVSKAFKQVGAKVYKVNGKVTTCIIFKHLAICNSGNLPSLAY